MVNKDRAKDSTDGTLAVGKQAEDLAADFLQRQGLQLLARNFRVRGGELDLVCKQGETLVFVEVRLRRNSSFGGAAASITAAKRRRVILAAQHYLARQQAHHAACRFDCVLLNQLDAVHIEWIRNAFTLDF